VLRWEEMRTRLGWCWAALVGAGALLAASPLAAHAAPDADATAAPPAPTAATAADPVAPDPVLGHADRVRPTHASDLVAFTFDDGPDPATTPQVLAALRRYDVPATFFVVTRRLVGARSDDALAVLAEEEHDGFVIGSHSWSHAHLDRIGQRRAAHEVDEAVTTLALALGRPVGLFRPPYGRLGRAAAHELARRGLTDVLWTIDTRDWRAHDPARLRRAVLRMILARHGGVVLMHDTKAITAHVLPEVLDDLEATNCARLARGDRPIVPVSIHYFLTDGAGPHRPGVARPVPPAIAARTAKYRAALPGRCARRPEVATAPATRVHHRARTHRTRRHTRRIRPTRGPRG
jgi:peptidoglycan-N-acetylglucosamine deacetylase